MTRQGYYAWAKRPESERVRADRALQEKVRAVHAKSRGTYGSPRIHAALRHANIRVSKRRIERLMRELGLVGRAKKRFRITTTRDESHPVAANLLARCFKSEQPNQRWATDITYIRTANGFSYLAVIIDLFREPSLAGQSIPTSQPNSPCVPSRWHSFTADRPLGCFITRTAVASTRASLIEVRWRRRTSLRA